MITCDTTWWKPWNKFGMAFDGLLAPLLERHHGKYVIRDQCGYGKVDEESGRPIKKPTGFVANCEVVLNHLGKRCRCACGAHQQVLGSSRFWQRSPQAAAYPLQLCKAICQGVLESMKLDYVAQGI